MVVLADTEIDRNRFRVNAGERRPVSHPADAVHLQVLTWNRAVPNLLVDFVTINIYIYNIYMI